MKHAFFAFTTSFAISFATSSFTTAWVFAAGITSAVAASESVPSAKPGRIVTLGGSVTETVFALGLGSQVIAVDLSSTYPPEVTALPKVGYHRALNAEGILALKPSHVLGTDEAGPPAALQQLRAARAPLTLVPVEHSLEGTKKKITAIAKALGREDAGRQSIALLESQWQDAQAIVRKAKEKPRVLFIYARGQGALSVSGRKTAADAIIQLAGGVNTVTGYEGYKPLTPEALAGAAPDIVLVTTTGLESLGGKTALLTQPGMALTPAGKSGRILSLDDALLLGFGPRLGQGILELARLFHNQPVSQAP